LVFGILYGVDETYLDVFGEKYMRSLKLYCVNLNHAVMGAIFSKRFQKPQIMQKKMLEKLIVMSLEYE
jgi:hypothetical protein